MTVEFLGTIAAIGDLIAALGLVIVEPTLVVTRSTWPGLEERIGCIVLVGIYSRRRRQDAGLVVDHVEG